MPLNFQFAPPIASHLACFMAGMMLFVINKAGPAPALSKAQFLYVFDAGFHSDLKEAYLLNAEAPQCYFSDIKFKFARTDDLTIGYIAFNRHTLFTLETLQNSLSRNPRFVDTQQVSYPPCQTTPSIVYGFE